MRRVDEDGDWSLFCPKNVPELLNSSGRSFEDAYRRYESSDIPRIKIKARELSQMMMRSLILTGGPSIVFKDSVICKIYFGQCTRTAQLNTLAGKTNLTETFPCSQADLRTGMIDTLGEDAELFPRNHASLTLPLFVTRDGSFDFPGFHRATKETVYALNKILDISMPHLSTIMDRNKDFRAIGVGINGLADVFTAMRLPYESLEAAELNITIAETMYHAALEASNDLAAIDGPYASFTRSPLRNGIMQFDFWEVTPSDRYDWATLCDRIRTTGVRNATLIAIGSGGGSELLSGFTRSTNPLPR